MITQDIRWIQRFNHFSKAFAQLKEAVELSQQRKLSKLEEQGLIQAFEYTYELAWNVLKDYLESQGETEIHGSRDAIRLAFRRGLIADGDTWMEMIRDRINSTHTYNEEMARKVAANVVNLYFPEFEKLRSKMGALKEKPL